MHVLETPVKEVPDNTRGVRPPWQWKKLAAIAVVSLLIAAFYATGLYRYLTWDAIRANLDDWQAKAAGNLPIALLVFFLVYFLVTSLSLPVAAPISLVAGALFGRWLGTGIVSLASTLGATSAFLMSRYVLRDWVQSRFADRLGGINRGVEKDGALYLFTLRLVPVVPFFLINLGMGLTGMRARTFTAVSWAGMLFGTFLYVNAGTAFGSIDSPGEILSTKVIVSLALLGLAPLVVRKLVQWKVRWKLVVLATAALLLLVGVTAEVRTYFRYQIADTMMVAVREYSNAEYPEDPSGQSVHHRQYDGRTLTLVKKDSSHFDFVFEPQHPHIAKVIFRDVDVSLMTPSLPDRAKTDDGLRRIALTDRQWNRQQVAFGGPDSPHIEITGGDGFEVKNLYSAELAKNCLNAGLWEVLLFTHEGGNKTLYYQGWFTFPLGHYRDMFEHNTGLPYWMHWYYLEHWFDPEGTHVPMEELREVIDEREVPAQFDRNEAVFFAGEQVRKRRTTVDENVRTWGDYFDGRRVRFASFIPPGKYDLGTPWKNEYVRMDRFDKAILRTVKPLGAETPLHELELIFSSTKRDGQCRFFVSGVDFDAVPQLPVSDYPMGLYMPMGIGVPPFYQSYAELQKNPPQMSPYMCVLLDADEKWIDHHSFAIDGPVIHRDAADPYRLHVYLLSYERHAIIAHLVVPIPSE